MRVGVTGSSGLVGTALCAHLAANGHEVVRIVRSEPAATEIRWDPSRHLLAPEQLAQLEAVVHLAGAGIGDHRWSNAYKRQLVDSRIDGTKLLAEAIATVGSGTTLISGSAVGFYGDRADEVLTEQSEPGTGFLPGLCQDWETASEPASAAGSRVVLLRSGIVLSTAGGALKKMLPMFKAGIGGRFGSGKHWMSWISIEDEIRAIEHLLASNVRGPVNLTAPAPVQNIEFTKTLARVLRRPAVLPIPAFGPRLLLGRELAGVLLYEGQRVLPTALLDDGYEFLHTDLEPALRALLNRRTIARPRRVLKRRT
jgi:uncharacterized protein (TIGR01777 family)